MMNISSSLPFIPNSKTSYLFKKQYRKIRHIFQPSSNSNFGQKTTHFLREIKTPQYANPQTLNRHRHTYSCDAYSRQEGLGIKISYFQRSRWICEEHVHANKYRCLLFLGNVQYVKTVMNYFIEWSDGNSPQHTC